MKKLLQDRSRCWRVLPLIFTITRDFQPLKIVVTLLLKVGIVGTHPVTTRNIAFLRDLEAKPLPLYHVPDFRSHQKIPKDWDARPWSRQVFDCQVKTLQKKTENSRIKHEKYMTYLLPKKVCKNRKYWRKKSVECFFYLMVDFYGLPAMFFGDCPNKVALKSHSLKTWQSQGLRCSCPPKTSQKQVDETIMLSPYLSRKSRTSPTFLPFNSNRCPNNWPIKNPPKIEALPPTFQNLPSIWGPKSLRRKIWPNRLGIQGF